MRIPSELKQLARLFPQEYPLFLVGGAVRDGLLNIQSTDYDVACALTTEEVKIKLEGSSYKVRGEYPRTGTLVIVGNRIICEYTTFRTDSYPLGRGDHSPEKVAFTKDIYQDALRRDFSCNAIYYDLVEESFIDPTDGITAIQNKLIVTTREPNKVLQEDALRILRIARLSCELGFHVQPDVIESAQAHVNGLRHIARERIGAELLKILNCRRKYLDFHDGFKPSYGLALLEEIGANELIFGKKVPFTTLCELDNLKEDGYYEYNTVMQLAVISLDNTPEQTKELCHKLALSNAMIADITTIIDGYHAIDAININDLTYGQAKIAVAKVYDHVKEIVALRMARGKEIDRLCEIAHIIENKHLPTKVSELKISGRAVIAEGYTGLEIGKVIDFVLLQSITNEITTQDEQLKLIKIYGGKK